MQLLDMQKALIQHAKRRKGELPHDHKPHQQLISEHMNQYNMIRVQAGTGPIQLNTAVIGEAYLPSIARFEQLKKVNIKQMRLEDHHRGSYVLVRTVVPAMRLAAVISLVEDETGTATVFSLYNAEVKPYEPAENVVPKDKVLIVKQPYFKALASGGYGLRVEHPTDIIWLSDDDDRVPLKWKPASAHVPQSVDQLRLSGNEMVKSGRFREAVEL